MAGWAIRVARTRLYRHPQAGQARRQASGPGGRRGERPGGFGHQPDRCVCVGGGVGEENPAHWALRLCKTFRSGQRRAVSSGARVPRAGPALHAVSGSAPSPARPRQSPSEFRTWAPAGGTSPELRGGRAGWVGEGGRAAGERVRLRACARGAPRFNCRAGARFRAPLVPRARLGQWGASGAGRPGAAEPMNEADQVRGRDLARGAPLSVPGVGVGVGSLAWPTHAGGRIRGAPGRESGSGKREPARVAAVGLR